MSDDNFFERLRGDAAPLRYEPDAVAFSRMSARIRDRVATPTVAELLARWFRPLAAAVTALALMVGIGAGIGAAVLDTPDESFASPSIELSVAGEQYHVGE
jgi:hypothetical protein